MGVPTPLLAALGGYLFTYYNTKITEERKAQIERINQQVRDLYGPLLATVNASRTAYRAMVRAHSPPNGDGSAAAFVAAVRRDPDGAEARVYRTWMRDVLQPLNERAAAIVVDHADLLESSHMPPLLLQLVAHVSANRVVLSRWSQGESGAASAIAYPDALPRWASSQFRGIKARQALLLGVKGSFSGGNGEEEEMIEGGQFDEYDEGGEEGRWERGAGGGGEPLPPPPPAGEMGEGAWEEPALLSAPSSKL